MVKNVASLWRRRALRKAPQAFRDSRFGKRARNQENRTHRSTFRARLNAVLSAAGAEWRLSCRMTARIPPTTSPARIAAASAVRAARS
jgi:hypothetical protein